MKKILLTFTALTNAILCGSAYADPECASLSETSNAKCEALGYLMTTSECQNLNYVTCPFDNTKVYCYRSKTKVCEAGDVLFNDRRCYYDLDRVPTGIKPMGVVFDAENKLAVELEGGQGIAAVESVDQDLLHEVPASVPTTFKVPKPFYMSEPTYATVEAANRSFQMLEKVDKLTGQPVFQEVKNQKTKLATLPANIAFRENANVVEYQIGKPIEGVTTLIDYDSCECKFESSIYNLDKEFKKANLIEAPKFLAKELGKLKDDFPTCPANVCATALTGFTKEPTFQKAVLEPYVEVVGNSSVTKLRRFQDFHVNGIDVALTRSDCAQVQRCKEAAMDYRSTSSTTGGWSDSNALYNWADALQEGTVTFEETGNYSANTEGSTCGCTNNQFDFTPCPGENPANCQIYKGKRVKELNITTVPAGSVKAAERCLALNGSWEYPGLLASSGASITSYRKPDGSAVCVDSDSCHNIYVYTYMAHVTNPRPDGDGWPSTGYSNNAYTPPVNYNKWFLPSIGDLGILGNNIHKVNSGLAAAARVIAKHNVEFPSDKWSINVNLIGINTPQILRPSYVSGATEIQRFPLLAMTSVTALNNLKEDLLHIAAKTRAAKSFEDMEYLESASGLLPMKLVQEKDESNNNLFTAKVSWFSSIKNALKAWIGTNKQVNTASILASGATKASFFTNESLWSSTMGYAIDDYKGPGTTPAGTGLTGEPLYETVTKKGINNYDYTWFYRPLPRTGEVKYGVAQSWQKGDSKRPRNVRCVFYYGASSDWN